MNDRLNQIVQRARREQAAAKREQVINVGAIAAAILTNPPSALLAIRPGTDYGSLEAMRINPSRIDPQPPVGTGHLGTPTLSVVRSPSISQLRSEFAALPAAERQDEIDRYSWGSQDPSRPQTIFAPYLSALGINPMVLPSS